MRVDGPRQEDREESLAVTDQGLAFRVLQLACLDYKR